MAVLTLSRTNTGGTKTLTGASDWEHYQANVSRTRMTGTPGLLSDYTKIGTFTELGYNDDVRLFSATDPSTSDHDGIYSGGTAVVGNGFSFTVPAGTTSQTLICYFGQFSADSVFTVSMTGGGVSSPQTDSQADPGFNVALASNFTIVFTAASPGQTLTVTHVIGATFSASYGNVTIAALALTAAAGAAGNYADFAQSAARSARRLNAAAGDPLPPLGRAFVSMAVPIDRPPPRRIGSTANDVVPALAVAPASSPAPDLAIGQPRRQPIAPTGQWDAIPPVVSRTIEAPTTYPAARVAPRWPADQTTVVAATAQGWAPDLAAAPPALTRRAAVAHPPAPAPLFLLLGGFEFAAAALPARPRPQPPQDAPPPLLFAGWAPPATEAALRARARALLDAALALPIPIAAAALTAWAPDLATGQRGWRRAPAIPYGGEPLPALIAAAQAIAWGHELPVPPGRAARRPAFAATDPIGPLLLAWGFEAPAPAWRPARAGAAPADPIAGAALAAWGWEVTASASAPARRAIASPDLVLVTAAPAIVVPPAEAARRRIWTPPPAPTTAIPLFVAPVVLPWGYETVEAARRPRFIRAISDVVVAGLIAAIRIPRASFGSGATRSGGSGGPTRSGGSSNRTK